MNAATQMSFGRILLMFGPAVTLFVLGGLTAIDTPGAYFDAVNPDYLVIRLLNPAAAQIPAWVVPGTLMFGKLPTIIAIYHGALPYYLGLPFYALFGTGIEGIRIANIGFGLTVLVAAGAAMWTFQVRPLVGSLCLSLLALDPSFLFSFRTQFYIVLIPVAAILASIAVAEATGDDPKPRDAMLGGLLAGLACYGYFVHLFFVPAVIGFALWRWRDQPSFGRLIVWWLAGFGIGVFPYAVGFALILVELKGFGAFLAAIRANAASLDVQSSTLSIGARFAYFAYLLTGTIANVGPTAMMLGDAVKPVLSGAKTILLFLLPALAIVSGLASPRRQIPGLLTVIGILAGFLVLVLAFGSRLWFQHSAPMLPVLYLALALSLERFCRLFAAARAQLAGALVALLLLPFLVANATARQDIFLRLNATGGVGSFSDALTRYALDSLRDKPAAQRYFPDWGIYMPFVMITRGNVPVTSDFSPAAAKAVLCAGRDIEVATFSAKPAERLSEWTRAIGWGEPDLREYEQRNGVPVLKIVRWTATAGPHGACPPS